MSDLSKITQSLSGKNVLEPETLDSYICVLSA